MVTGRKRIEINKELILNRIGPLAIYEYYIPGLKIGIPMLSPFRREKNSSFVVKQSDNGYYHKDYGALEFSGSCIKLVEQLFSLSFTEALEKIARDFGLLEGKQECVIKIKEVVPQEKKKKIPDIIEVIPKPFGKEHLQYLQEFHISPNSLDIFPEVKVVAVKEWRLNRLKMPLKLREVAFAYIVEGQGIKLYRPHANKMDKWMSTIPNRIILGLESLQPCETLIITKSVKEAAILHEYLKIPVIVVQSESISCFTEESITKINSLAKKVYCSFDIDEPGKRANWSVTNLTGWKHVNVNDQYLQEGIKDWGDLIKKYGPQPIIDHFKQKEII